ncbi:MAG: hypothetical protein WCV88_00455 [Patescibacteria group bacterium]|jgi:NAD+ kinase
MKVVISGLQKLELARYIKQHYPKDIQIVKSKPDFVLCYGGDGTLLYAERHYPMVPKVMIRHSRVCQACARTAPEVILRLLVRGQYSLQEQTLLEAKYNQQTIYGLNDIVVAHASANSGLRYHVWIDHEPFGDEMLGDGVVVSTPLGSAGYFQSITHSTFKQGMGVAFNNSIAPLSHSILPVDSIIKIRVDRGPALLVSDNDDRIITVPDRDTVTIRQSHRSTLLVFFSGKANKRYNIGIGENRVPLCVCQMCGKLIKP